VDAWGTLLWERIEDDGLPCYHLREKYSTDVLGHLLQSNAIGQGDFKRLLMEAGIRPIKFHGLRHTCATLLLQAGVPVRVVQERLGHKEIEITLGIYAHVLPTMQQDAATKLAALLQT
jgi:integrase